MLACSHSVTCGQCGVLSTQRYYIYVRAQLAEFAALLRINVIAVARPCILADYVAGNILPRIVLPVCLSV